jgi:peptide/nickel transport system permease protein
MSEHYGAGFWSRFSQHRIGQAGSLLLLAFLLLAIFAPLLTPYNPVDVDLAVVRQSPGQFHWLGTDELGRDIWSRLIYGARVSLLVGIASVLIATTLGLGFGIVSGYLGGHVDAVLMRVLDGLLSLPSLLLVIAMQSFGHQGLWNVIIVIAFTSWMQTARLVRTEFLSIKQRPFIKAAVAVGTPQGRLVFRHILPNCLASIAVLATISVGHAIVTEAALSFLGLGIPPHEPSWGNMLMDGQRSILMGAWWITFFPGLMIILTVLSVNLVGDAFRDALSPFRSNKSR